MSPEKEVTSGKFWKFIEKNPNKSWYELSRNPNITWEIVEKNPDKPWDWKGLSQNPNITWEIVEKNINKPWNWDWLSRNGNITWEIVEKNPDKPWNWNGISLNPNITWEIVEKNPDKSWNWNYLSFNPNITSEFVEKNLDKPWDWNELSSNPNITWEIIEKNPDKPWNWYWLSRNPNITWEIIEKNPDKPWDWFGLSENPNITWEIVEKNPDKPWNWYVLSKNPNITWEIVEKNLKKPWDWSGLSSNPNITWEIVEKNLKKPWDWKELSRNPNITSEILEKNPDKPWDWKELSKNPNITFRLIEKNLDKPWDWVAISNNPFLFLNKEILEKPITEKISIDELTKENLTNFAKEIGISYAHHIPHRIGLLSEIKKKLGYFDVMVDITHQDISMCKTLTPGSFYDLVPNLPKPSSAVLPTKKTYTLYYEETEEDFEKKFGGLGNNTLEQFIDSWRKSLKLSLLYSNDEEIDEDIQRSLRENSNLTRFPDQDTTFFIRNQEGRCTLDPQFIYSLDEKMHSLEHLIKIVEKSFPRYPRDIVERLSDEYINYELVSRGYKVRKAEQREFFFENFTRPSKTSFDSLISDSEIPRIPPVEKYKIFGNIPSTNLYTFLAVGRVSPKILLDLSNYTKTELTTLLRRFDCEELFDEREILQLLLFLVSYYKPTITLSKMRELPEDLEMLRNNIEDPSLKKYAEVIFRLRKLEQEFPSIKKLCLEEKGLEQKYPNSSVSSSIFNLACFTNIKHSFIPDNYGNDIALKIATLLYGYGKDFVPLSPSQYIMSIENRYLTTEKIIALLLSGKEYERVDGFFIPQPDLSERENILQFVNDIKNYVLLIEGEEKPMLKDLDYTSLNISHYLSAFRDSELQRYFGVSEWKGRQNFFNQLREWTMSPNQWRIYPSSELCKNGREDIIFGMERTESLQLSFGSLGDLKCFNTWELLSGFLFQEISEYAKTETGEIDKSFPTVVELTKEGSRITLIFDRETRISISNFDCIDTLLNKMYYLYPSIYTFSDPKKMEVSYISREAINNLHNLLQENKETLKGDGCGEVLSLIVKRLNEDYQDPRKVSLFIGDVVKQKYEAFSKEKKEDFLRFLTSTFVMGILARFWLDPILGEFKNEIPYDYRKITGDFEGGQVENRRNIRVFEYYYTVVQKYQNLFSNTNSTLFIPQISAGVLTGRESPKFMNINISKLIYNFLSGNFCAKDFSDRMFMFSFFYIGKIEGINNFPSVLNRYYVPMEGFPQRLPPVDPRKYIFSGHKDPLLGNVTW